ncbi:hypothetical protein EZS27_032061 [termite gut metagenome]|jgi:hypothetical protein|uniref:Uncharacterized protein n=1 Tax=termite gut metagenome TaxID=433724 RepID=A0A5J4QAV2_9ZZZZ
MDNNKLYPTDSSIILYQDDTGATNINVRFDEIFIK